MSSTRVPGFPEPPLVRIEEQVRQLRLEPLEPPGATQLQLRQADCRMAGSLEPARGAGRQSACVPQRTPGALRHHFVSFRRRRGCRAGRGRCRRRRRCTAARAGSDRPDTRRRPYSRLRCCTTGWPTWCSVRRCRWCPRRTRCRRRRPARRGRCSVPRFPGASGDSAAWWARWGAASGDRRASGAAVRTRRRDCSPRDRAAGRGRRNASRPAPPGTAASPGWRAHSRARWGARRWSAPAPRPRAPVAASVPWGPSRTVGRGARVEHQKPVR
jgi:hypothetical protein